MSDIIQIGFKVNTAEVEKGYNRFEKMGKAAEGAEAKTNKALGTIGKSAGQAGIQVQQFVGQVQMGTSPLVAFSQQAADLGIVLGLPLLGAITGIAASIGAVLLPSLFDAEDATDKLKETLEAIDKVAIQTASGTFTLTEEIARLAKVSETAANAQIALSITEATQAINLARDAAKDAVGDLDDLLNGFDVVATQDVMDNLNETLSRTGLTIDELLGSTSLYATGLTQLRSFSESLNESLGTTTSESVDLIKAVSEFKSGGSLSSLADTFSNISLSTDGATKKFQSLAVNLNTLSLTTEKSEAVLKLLEETMGDLDSILSNSETITNDLVKSFNDKTEALDADELQMAKNIAVQQLGKDATKEEIEAVKNAIDSYYNKVRAIKAESDAQSKAKKEAKERAASEKKAAESYAAQVKALDDLVVSLGLAADEQMVYAQVQQSIARGDTPEQTAAIEAQTRAYLEQKNMLDAIGESVTKYENWINSISTTSTQIAGLRAEIEKTQQAVANGDLTGSTGEEYIADLESQIKSLEVNPFESMTQGASDALSAMSGMFESGSKDAKKLAIAMEALNLVQAVGAVLNQGNGDPYTAFGRMAAMATMVASLGMSIGGLSGGLSDESADNQANQNLNSWGEHSESIADSTELVANATEKLVGINTNMLEALQGLNLSITAAAGIAARNASTPTINQSNLTFDFDDAMGILDPAGVFDIVFDPTGFLGGITEKIFDSLLGGESKVTDEGIRIMGGYIADLVDDITIDSFQSVKYKKWKFGSTKRKTVYENVGDDVEAQFSLVFDSIINSVAVGAEMLGVTQGQIESAINQFEVATQNLSLKDLDVDERVEVINNYFSSVFNDLAVSVIPFLEKFQQAGEELGTTLTRLATEVSVAEYLVDNFGVQFGDKMANPEAFAQAATNLAALAGGVEELAEQTSSFTNAFATDAQKFDIYSNAMNEALNSVGLTLPSTAEGLFNLMSTLDGTTESGQEQIATLLGLTDTATAYYKLLEDTAGAYREAAEGLYDITEASRNMSLESALAAARLGDFSLAEQLDLSSIAPSTSDFATQLDYNLARAETAARLNELADLQGGKLTVEDKQLTVLEQIRDKLGDSDTMSNQSLVNEVSALKVQMNKQQTETNEYLRRMTYREA